MCAGKTNWKTRNLEIQKCTKLEIWNFLNLDNQKP